MYLLQSLQIIISEQIWILKIWNEKWKNKNFKRWIIWHIWLFLF